MSVESNPVNCVQNLCMGAYGPILPSEPSSSTQVFLRMYKGQLYFERPKIKGEDGYKRDRFKRWFLRTFTSQYDLSQSLPALNKVLNAASILPQGTDSDPRFSRQLYAVRSLYDRLSGRAPQERTEEAKEPPPVFVGQGSPQGMKTPEEQRAQRVAPTLAAEPSEQRPVVPPAALPPPKTIPEVLLRTIYHQRVEAWSRLNEQVRQLHSEYCQYSVVLQPEGEPFPIFDGSSIRKLIDTVSRLSTECASIKCENFDSRIAQASHDYQQQVELLGQWTRRRALWTQFDLQKKRTEALLQTIAPSSPIHARLTRCKEIAAQGMSCAKEALPLDKIQKLEQNLVDLTTLIRKQEDELQLEIESARIQQAKEALLAAPSPPKEPPTSPEEPGGGPISFAAPAEGPFYLAEKQPPSTPEPFSPVAQPAEQRTIPQAVEQPQESPGFKRHKQQLLDLATSIEENEQRRQSWVQHIRWPGITDRLQGFAGLTLECRLLSEQAETGKDYGQITKSALELARKTEQLRDILNTIERQYVVYAQYALDRYQALRFLGERSKLGLVAYHEDDAARLQGYIVRVGEGNHLSGQELNGLFEVYQVIEGWSEGLKIEYSGFDLAADPAYQYLKEIQSIQEANLVLLEYFPSLRGDQKTNIDQLKDVYEKAKKLLMQKIEENDTKNLPNLAQEYQKANTKIVDEFLSDERWKSWHIQLDVPLSLPRDEFLQLNAQERLAYLQRTLNARSSPLRKLKTGVSAR